MPKPRGKRHTYTSNSTQGYWSCKNAGCWLHFKSMTKGRRISYDGGKSWHVEPKLTTVCPVTPDQAPKPGSCRPTPPKKD
jgi:hypothetical protein